MPRSIEIPFGAVTLQLTLSALVIRLYAYDTNPSHINPDFLRFNDVVPADWTVVTPVLAQPGFSRTNYSNGLSVVASNDYVSFAQAGLLDPNVPLIVPDVASRYLRLPPPGLTFDSVSVEPACILMYPPHAMPPVQPQATYHFDIAIPANGIEPEIAVRSTYRFPDRNIAVTVSHEPDEGNESNIVLSVRGQTHYPIGDEHDDLPYAQNLVRSWQPILQEFYNLGAAVCSRQISIGVG